MNSNSVALTPAFVAESLSVDPRSVAEEGLRLPPSFSEVSTDSRSCAEGSLFVALQGEKFDGHDFLTKALERKVGGLLVAKSSLKKVPKDARRHVAIYVVPDTLVALRALAAAWRRQFTFPVVAVAGSVGKTTTKELIAAALRGRYKKLKKTEASQNGFLGVALTLLRLRPGDEAAVVEIGIDEPGAMAQHLELVRPTASVVTAIAEEHLHQMIDLETIAREESLALTWVGEKKGVVALATDDPWLAPLVTHGSLLQAIRYSLSERKPEGPIPCLWGRLEKSSHTLHVDGLSERTAFFPVPLPGVHNARNLLAAVAVAHGLGLSETQIRSGLQTFEAPQGRSELRDLPGGVQLLCDWYNASPASTRSALELLSQLSVARGGTAWACLADMLELGPEEKKLHASLAEAILKSRAGVVLLTGPLMKSLHEELRRREVPGRIEWFPTVEELAAAVKGGVKKGDVVLVKGSRGMRMERVAPFLETERR